LYSILNHDTIIELGLALTYHPFGNTNLWGTTSAEIPNFNNRPSNKKDRQGPPLIYNQSIGFSLFNKVWIDGGFTYGTLANYSENNGFVVFNSSDKIVNKWNVGLTVPINKKIEAKISYSYYYYQSTFMSYFNEYNYNIKPTKYENQSIIGGIKWKL
jgi:hypothetical protein